MSLDEAARARVAPYVSALSGDVFAVRGLPEERLAAVFAQFSRTRDDLRATLAAQLDGAPPAPPFAVAPAGPLAPSLAGYGHASPSEHAIVHLAVENLSILAAKAIEDLRLGSFIEKSVRHAVFDRASFVTPAGIAADPESAALYRHGAERLFRAYLELMPRVIAALRAKIPRPDGTREDTYATFLRLRACDLLRGLIPAGARTGLVLTANARALALALAKLLAHPLAEVRAHGASMLASARHVAPTLLADVTASPYRAGLRDAVAASLRPLYTPPAEGAQATMVVSQPVRLLRFDKDALERITLALAYDESDPRAHAHGIADGLRLGTQSELAGLLASALHGRGPTEAPPRGFEATSFTFELMPDYGTYRDLQRHRLVSRATQQLGCRLGFDTPAELTELGFGDPYQTPLFAAYDTWLALHGKHPSEAAYAVPLGYKLRTLWTLDLRELFHVIELRSGRASHPTTRRFALALFRAASQVHPWLSALVRVDSGDDALPSAG